MEELVIVTADNSFTAAGKVYIDKVAQLFHHFALVQHDGNSSLSCWQIDGTCFGEKWSPYEFQLFPRKKDEFGLQFAKKGHSQAYMFGLEFFNDANGIRHAKAYHHPHGPFTAIYGCAYECD